MKTPTQFAAEAAEQILAMPMINEYLKPEIEAIIQSAIEKALKPLLVQREEMWKTIQELTSRAAQAEEEVEVCQSCGSPVDSGEEYCSWCDVETRDSR